MWAAIKRFFSRLFGGSSSTTETTTSEDQISKLSKLAQTVVTLIAANNKEKVVEILPYLTTALTVAKEGTITAAELSTLFSTIRDKTDNNAAISTAITLLQVELSDITVGTVSTELITILTAMVKGLTAGSAS